MAEVNKQPPTKRSKLTGDKDFSKAWEHYQNYIDGGGSDDEEEDTESDVDELYEIISILSSTPITPRSDDFINNGDAVVLLGNIQSLLPILLSMTYLHLANYSITTDIEDVGSTDNDTSPDYYFEKSLHYWPSNPAALSLLANYHRMNNLSSIKSVCQLYIKASESAKFWRDIGIKFLQSFDVEEDVLEGINIKELVEVLIINGALEIDYIGKEDDEEDEEGDEDSNVDEKDTHDEYSCSEVECTASFMSAFLLSTMNQHDDALLQLKQFRHLSHRIHPNVWKAAAGTLSHDQNDSQTTTSVLFEPRIYRGDDTNGILPTDLYQSLCSLFAPDAPYWQESDYQNRGYYSYFMPVEKAKQPTNVIEDVIVSHLLPLAEQQCSESIVVVGYEWWVHTRPTRNSLGHPLHFDTDESLLARDKTVSHPIISSVMYLTGAERDKDASAGPTIVFDQTADSTDVASKAWISKSQDNSLMIFPGNLLHGVLPCSGGCSDLEQSTNEKDNHRLTFMVGFWTRDVTIGMNDRSLYSACGPLPPPCSEHTWVMQNQNGYLNKTKTQGEETKTISDLPKSDVLECASPAWEQFKEDDYATLVIPGGLDHKYFVSNAPQCFSDDLFEK